ncbi:MAG: zf-HC2 domain-containing protein [Polyangiaceae bacterium]|jgi:hypothetical protein|nr:zf-HC2 domain-containing protein [Polyangiaceae bacterium]MBK8938941.1 zf-HC2 domain-containing protein [Polyangiaceae bacterium]
MDCEKFDLCVMDALYGELDELTAEALKRHVEGCPRCGAAWSGLKSTRSAVSLPLEDPPMGLEARILAAEKTVHHRAPWHRKIMRAAAWAGSHAMRPQLAMAALFMFVIGSSLLLLRGRPTGPVKVSEEGRAEAPSPVAQAAEERETISGAKGLPGDSMERAGRGRPEAAPAPAAVAAAEPSAAAEAFKAEKTDEGDSKTLDFTGAGCAEAGLALQAAAPDSQELKEAEAKLAACKAKAPAKVSASAPAAATTVPQAPPSASSGW